MRPDNLLDLFEIDPAAANLPEDARPVPVLVVAPAVIEFGNPDRLDPSRARAEPEPAPPKAGQRTRPFVGLLGSLSVHLLPLLLLLQWSGAPAELAVPIPVQLVIEQPPPPPPPKSQDKVPPLGRLASQDTGKPAVEPDRQAVAAEPAAVRPRPIELATALPPPKPIPSPGGALVPKSAAPPTATVPREPKPMPHVGPAKRPVAARPAPNPRPTPRRSHVPGPAATRDEYLAYCMALIRRYYHMVPLSFIADRRGLTTLSVVVLDDGTIARIAIAHSSGYRDIDVRIEQMLAAVRRFPPLPQRFQGPSVTMYFDMPFPDGLTH